LFAAPFFFSAFSAFFFSTYSMLALKYPNRYVYGCVSYATLALDYGFGFVCCCSSGFVSSLAFFFSFFFFFFFYSPSPPSFFGPLPNSARAASISYCSFFFSSFFVSFLYFFSSFALSSLSSHLTSVYVGLVSAYCTFSYSSESSSPSIE
jgi:hypothetical protein